MPTDTTKKPRFGGAFLCLLVIPIARTVATTGVVEFLFCQVCLPRHARDEILGERRKMLVYRDLAVSPATEANILIVASFGLFMNKPEQNQSPDDVLVLEGKIPSAH
ncbi:hypothetical protein [Dyella sp.]|uniref:hypothetical protein n=1 Tax=Dyella sp. TaxID=1869338 RepID=UPI002852B21A|nr:hypothetical protein [Dyella sp.]